MTEPDFTPNLRQVIAPPLLDAGFVFDGRRVFRRALDATHVQIVEIQLGNRFMQGKFTINLAVFHRKDDAATIDLMTVREYDCPWNARERLGRLLPSVMRPLQHVPILGAFFGPKDVWWPVKGTNGAQQAKDALVTYGLPWLKRKLAAP